MTLSIALAIVGGVALTAIAALTLLYLDHIARCEDNDENNYPSEESDRP